MADIWFKKWWTILIYPVWRFPSSLFLGRKNLWKASNDSFEISWNHKTCDTLGGVLKWGETSPKLRHRTRFDFWLGPLTQWVPADFWSDTVIGKEFTYEWKHDGCGFQKVFTMIGIGGFKPSNIDEILMGYQSCSLVSSNVAISGKSRN